MLASLLLVASNTISLFEPALRLRSSPIRPNRARKRVRSPILLKHRPKCLNDISTLFGIVLSSPGVVLVSGARRSYFRRLATISTLVCARCSQAHNPTRPTRLLPPTLTQYVPRASACCGYVWRARARPPGVGGHSTVLAQWEHHCPRSDWGAVTTPATPDDRHHTTSTQDRGRPMAGAGWVVRARPVLVYESPWLTTTWLVSRALSLWWLSASKMSGWDAYIAALLGDKSVMTGAAIYVSRTPTLTCERGGERARVGPLECNRPTSAASPCHSSRTPERAAWPPISPRVDSGDLQAPSWGARAQSSTLGRELRSPRPSVLGITRPFPREASAGAACQQCHAVSRVLAPTPSRKGSS